MDQCPAEVKQRTDIRDKRYLPNSRSLRWMYEIVEQKEYRPTKNKKDSPNQRLEL
jgi:hypothetical protein